MKSTAGCLFLRPAGGTKRENSGSTGKQHGKLLTDDLPYVL